MLMKTPIHADLVKGLQCINLLNYSLKKNLFPDIPCTILPIRPISLGEWVKAGQLPLQECCTGCWWTDRTPDTLDAGATEDRLASTYLRKEAPSSSPCPSCLRRSPYRGGSTSSPLLWDSWRSGQRRTASWECATTVNEGISGTVLQKKMSVADINYFTSYILDTFLYFNVFQVITPAPASPSRSIFAIPWCGCLVATSSRRSSSPTSGTSLRSRSPKGPRAAFYYGRHKP